MKRKVRPNVVSGGTAINLGNNLYYMRGKTHKQGGIDIGSNPKTGIEVENGEVVQTSPKGLRVFSAQPILNGISPANALLMGGNPNNIFNAQEAWKQANHYNDDGTKFKGGGEEKKSLKDRVRNKLIDAYYNTTFKPAIKKYGIDEVRLRLYDNVEPYGYENAQSRIDYAINKKPLSDSERKDYLFSTKSGVTKYRDDIWRTYLNIDKKYSHYDDNYGHKVIESKYKPTNSRENKKYYTITHDDLYAGGNKGRLVNEALFGNPVSIGALKHGENRLSNTLWLYFGNHTISRGMDPEKGDYVSFYDLWDIAPSEKNKRTGRKDESRGIGTPIEFYDRLYLNDYFGVKPKVPKDSYYEGYLTPALISEEKKYGGYTPSKEILDYIKKTEGFRDKWYKDGNGIDTIGYGFTGNRIKKLYPNGITREQADKEFADSIAKRAAILQRDTPNWEKLSQNQRDALLSYHYNVGEGSYRNNHPKLQQALTDSDWEAVMLNMDAGYNDKKNPGLRTRRDYERELFRSGMIASLTGDEEKAFRDWYDRYSRSQNLDPNPDAKEYYYDYRAYWKNRTEQQKNDEWKLGNHLPDTYKLPGHPTFSTESIYSTRKTPGGTWKKVGLGPVYDEQFVDSKYTKRLKKYNNVSFALGGDDLKQNGYIEPSVVTAPLPKKFKGSQTAARRYAEGYQFGKQIAKERDKTAPYILAAANAPMLIEGLAVAPLATMTSIAGGYVGEEIGNKIDGPLGGVIGGFIGGGVGGGLGGRLSGGLRGGLGSGVRTGIKAGIKPIGKSIVNFGKFLKSRYIYNKSVRTGNKIYENAFNILKNRGVDEFKASTSAYDLQKIYEDNFLYKEPGKPGDITGLYYFLDNDDEAVVFNIKNLLKKNNKPTQYSSADVAKWISRDASSLKPGNRIELVADFDLSKDSAPLYLRSLQRGHINGEGKMYPIIDDNTQRMIRLNTFGKNKKSIRRIDTALNSIREIPGFKNTPSRIGVGGIQYIPAFGFEHFKYGGIHIKPSKRGTFTAAAKRHNMSVQEFARKVLNNRARFSAAMVKKANFARNASKWHKKELGGDMTKQYYITKDNIYSLGGNVRRKAFLGAEEYERFIDADGKMKYRIGDSVYSKDGFSRVTGMNSDEIDSYFDAIDNEGRGEVSPSILRNYRTIGYNRALQRTVPFIDSLNGITYLGEQKPEIEPSIITGEIKSTVAKSTINTSTNTNSKQSKAKSFKSETNVEPSIIKAYRTPKQGVRQNTIGFDSSLEGVQYYGPNRDNELPEQQTYNSPAQRTRLSINTSGRPTARAIGFAQLRHYDGRPIETPTSGTQSSPTGGQRRNSNRPTASSVPTAPAIPIDYDVSQSLNNDILTPITGRQLSPIASTNPQGLAGGTSVRTIPKNPYYSKLNVELHKIGNYIRNNPDLLGLGINLTGNLAASLINRSAIKGMRYVDTPIPISAQKLPTEVNIEPQVSSIRENVAGQERLIADNTADSRVALARRQRVRNQGAQQYQTLFGNKLNTELQLLTADRLNRQGVDAQNVTQYNQWRRGLYDFENRRREMLAENAVAGINNAAEAIAGERGYLARREARRQNLLNMGLIAATSPNAQNVIGSKEFEEFLRKIGYDGNFSLLRKRING